MLTNSILAKRSEISLFKVRRWTKELLPPDPIAKRRSGHAREFSNNDGFFVYLGGHLLSEVDLTFSMTRKILEALKPKLLAIGLVPDIPESAKRKGVDALIVRDYDVYIMPNIKNAGDFYLNAQILLSIDVNDKKDSFGKNYLERSSKVASYWIGVSPPNDDISKSFGETYTPTINLPVGFLLYEFTLNVLGVKNYQDWQKKFNAIRVPRPKKSDNRSKSEK